MSSQISTMVSRVSTSFFGHAFVIVMVLTLIAASAVGASGEAAKARRHGSPAAEQQAGR